MKGLLFWTMVLMGLVAHAKTKNTSELTPAWVRAELRKVATAKANCARKNCSSLKLYQDYQRTLQSLDLLQERSAGLTEEAKSLRNAVQICQSGNSLSYRVGCDKRQLRKELLLDHGIEENGSPLFPKVEVHGANAVCWSNSRKKKIATIVLCEFPLAITVMTKGGTSKQPMVRHREYLFSPNQCIEAVRITDESSQGKRVSELSYKDCEKEWNNKNFQELDESNEVRKIDIIGACFRYYLLPNRGSKAGRTNPDVQFGPGAK
ncbi:MAG: hypothetical protein IT289_00550 [Oligoflexia bacterium]|nr:hypothetical protein [Oligoflexia bacterium]